jgi:hypothetical protein
VGQWPTNSALVQVAGERLGRQTCQPLWALNAAWVLRVCGRRNPLLDAAAKVAISIRPTWAGA